MDRWGQCAMWQCFQTIPVHHLVWSLVEIRGRCCGQQRIYGSTSTFSRDLENKVIVGFFHSWIYLFNEEQDGDFNYLGYIIQTVEHWIDQCHFNSRRFVYTAPSRPLNWMLAPAPNWIWQLELCATSHVPTFLASSRDQTESSTPGKRVPSLTMESSTSRAPIPSSNQRKLWREIWMTMYNNIQIHIRLKW